MECELRKSFNKIDNIKETERYIQHLIITDTYDFYE